MKGKLMEVVRVAWTITDLYTFGQLSGYIPQNFTDGPNESDELAEAAGRLCYKSWNRPNPNTANTSGYIANILDKQHFSVLEHASVSYYVKDVSRNLLTELERHRHLSFSVVSQRYVDHSGVDYTYPPVFDELSVFDRGELLEELRIVSISAEYAYKTIYDFLIDKGYRNKEAREAARFALPGATMTEFIVTGNLRAWREILQKRISPNADREIQKLANLFLIDLKEYAPATFQDFE